MPDPRENAGPFDASHEGTDFSRGMGGPIDPDSVTPKVLPSVTPRVTPKVTPINQKVSSGHLGVPEQQQ